MLSPESSAEAGKWYTSRTPYLRGIMDAASDPAVGTVVVESSSQVGKTETLLNVVGFHIHQEPAPMLLLEPTLDMAEAISKDRVAPMIRDCAVLTQLVGDPRSRYSDNTLLHKRFAGGHLTLSGANSAAGLSSRPIRILLCDEVDRYPSSAGTEGDPVALAVKRTTTFWNRKLIFISSPTTENLSRIDAAFEGSDKRFFHVPCYKCGTRQKLEWEYVHWEEGRPATAVYLCRVCGTAWDDQQRYEAIHNGIWIAEKPFEGTAGFHLNEMYNPWVALGEMATRYLDAKHKADRGDLEALRAFENTSLAKTWRESAEVANPEPLLARRENYSAEALPYRILFLTAGVDVQDDRFEIEVVGWRQDTRKDPEESWGVIDEVIYGDLAQGEVWLRLDEFLKREFMTEDGRRLRIAAVCIDSGGHHTQEVYRFCGQRVGRHIYAIKGMDGARPIWPRRAGKSKRYVNSLVWTVGVDTAKDGIYSRLKVETPGPGYCHFPLSYQKEFFAELTSEQVKTRFVRGHPVRYWYKPSGVRNEALDRRVYATAALLSGSVPWEVLLRAAPTEPPPTPTTPQGGGPPAPPRPPAQPPQPGRRRKIRYRFGR
jgi:phage terminase large subunit GpA-like protein